MKRSVLLGTIFIGLLIIFQPQIVYAAPRDFVNTFGSGDYRRAERILTREISGYDATGRSLCYGSIINRFSGNDMIRWLDMFPNVNQRFGEMPYFSALAGTNKNMDAVNYLLSRNIQPSISCVDLALREGVINIFEYFLRSGGDIDQRQYTRNGTMLMTMARNGNLNVVRLLVENGARVNLRDDDGSTAASLAYDRGEIEIYNYLKEHGAIDYEPRQAAAQPATPAPSTTIVNVQPSTPAQPTPAPSQSTPVGWNLSVLSGPNNIGGTWTSSVGRGNFMVLNGNGSSGTVNVQMNGRASTGTVTVSGNTLNIYITSGQFSGEQFRYTIVTNRLIQGDGENFSR